MLKFEFRPYIGTKFYFPLKFMGFPSVFLFCTKKITWYIWRKRKFRPYIETKLQCFTWFIWRKTFLQDFLRYTNKNQWSFYLR